MKRKVKFQEGGAVEEPSPRSRQLRERMDKMGREGRRVGLAERAREREMARRRAAAQREIDRLNPGQTAGEAERRAGRGVPERAPDFTTDERGTTRRGAATGREVVPSREQLPARPSASRALTEVVTPRQMPLGSPRAPVGGNLATIAATTGAALAEPLVNYGREFAERRGAEADARREANLQAFRAQEQAPPADGPAAGSMQSAPSAPRPAPRPAARPAPARPRVREMTADELNEMELRRIRAERQMMEDELRRTRREEPEGGSGNIGAASARERGEQVGPPGQYNMKKGGKVPAPKAVVKKKAGGMIAKPKAAPAKMKKGGAVAKPKGKPMPFKKGGAIKMKGRK
ncbi:hypothetical protein UFOVP735_75 [uncultured Caudovirales phage]|uniref:Uncharacterized protein n=1 Tax=uncultured Caudovirales phage TaxID=2100421 RepID=A0A6J7X2N5_9CAUD|nr:hypothetical protein UFOVP735_75 [uncultured Caudovirales phage]